MGYGRIGEDIGYAEQQIIMVGAEWQQQLGDHAQLRYPHIIRHAHNSVPDKLSSAGSSGSAGCLSRRSCVDDLIS